MDLKFALNVSLVVVAFLALISAQKVDLSDYPGEACYRNCDGTAPRICYFKFHIERYHVLGQACGNCFGNNSTPADCFNPQCVTADGVERGIMTVNRKLPGDSIHVCRNDLIVVDAINMMSGVSTTLHWHGFLMKESPWMDGVPFVTQCPIQFANTFRYQFHSRGSGTQWYHSHAGGQKVNGIFGGIVERIPKKDDPNGGEYDFDLKEHLILISDWMEVVEEQFSPGLRSQAIQPSNLLINGKGTVIKV